MKILPWSAVKPLPGAQLDRSHPLSKYVTLCWLMNEGAGGTLFDISGGGNNGTIANTFAWKPAKTGIGLQGPGVVNAKITTSAITTGTTFSIETWMRWTPTSQYVTIAAHTGAPGFFVSVTGSKLDWYQAGDHVGNTSLVTGNWYHCVLSVAAGAGTFYLNGNSDGTVAGIASTTLTDWFGNAVPQTLGGLVDLCRYYGNYALSPAEVLQLYQQPYAMIAAPAYRKYFSVPAGGTVFNKTLSASSSVSGSILRQINALRSASSPTSAALVRQTNKSTSASSATSGAVVKQAQKSISAASPASAFVSRSIGKALSAASSGVAVVARLVGKTVSAVCLPVGSVVRSVLKTLSASSTCTAAISSGRAFLRTLSATCGTAATLARQAGKTLSAASSGAASLVRSVSKRLSANSVTAGSVVRSVAKTFSASSTATASITSGRAFLRTLAASVGSMASLSKVVGKGLVAGSSVTATLRRGVTKILQASSSVLAFLGSVFQSGGSSVSLLLMRIVRSLNDDD